MRFFIVVLFQQCFKPSIMKYKQIERKDKKQMVLTFDSLTDRQVVTHSQWVGTVFGSQQCYKRYSTQKGTFSNNIYNKTIGNNPHQQTGAVYQLVDHSDFCMLHSLCAQESFQSSFWPIGMSLILLVIYNGPCFDHFKNSPFCMSIFAMHCESQCHDQLGRNQSCMRPQTVSSGVSTVCTYCSSSKVQASLWHLTVSPSAQCLLPM